MKRASLITLTVAALLLSAVPAVAQDAAQLLDRARNEAQVMAERTRSQVRELVGEAEQAIARRQWTEATTKLRRADRLLATARNLSADTRANLSGRVAEQWTAYETAHSAYEQQRSEKMQDEVEQRRRQREAAATLFAERRHKAQWERMQEYRRERRYDDAADVAEAILQHQPNDEAAREAAQDMDYLAGMQESVESRVERRRSTRQALIDTEESAIPYSKLVNYPPPHAWEQLSRRRLRDLAVRQGISVEETPARRALQTRIDLDMSNVNLHNVITYLGEAATVPIVVDPHLQDETGVDVRNEIVSLEARNLTLEQALNMILPQATGWHTQQDHIFITSREKANPLITINYPVQHLVAEVPDFGKTVPRMNLEDLLSQSGDSGGGGVGIFEDAFGEEADTEPPQDTIINLIKKFINGNDPQVAAWEEMGGAASIDYFRGTLIISQTEAGHRRIARLLGQL